MKQIAVVIPVYKTSLDAYERISLDRTIEVLGKHDIYIVHPEDLDTGFLTELYPNLKFRAFPPEYFKGIMGYNRLMLSEEFYSAFSDYEYILICQSDAYIFRDELNDWCEAGYDYVGAPWLRRPLYDVPGIKQFMDLSHHISQKNGQKSKQDLYGKIGNGGLSLRKVKSHLDVIHRQAETIAKYLDREKKDHLYNEDVFWATEPENFRYPTAEKALAFSFDKYPSYCYRLTDNRLPMGCHAWWKRKMRPFWHTLNPAMFPDKE